MRSFVERTLFIKGEHSSPEVFLKFPKNPSRIDLSKIAEALGWFGCYGVNKMLHRHTNYPMTAIFKNIQDISYSENEYLSYSNFYDLKSTPSGFCPVCVAEDIECSGFSFWRRAHCLKIKVCAKHNVELVKRCPACDKQFSHGGHELGVMWTTCSGLHLKDSPVKLNTDLFELKKARIFTDILSFNHHLSEEAVLAVLCTKFYKDAVIEEKDRSVVSDIHLKDRIERRLEIVKKSRSINRLPPNQSTDFLVLAIVKAYENFADFVCDVKAYGDEVRPTESLWSTYIAGHQESTHFVEENYELGVGSWSCPFPAKQVCGMWDWRPVYYPCCNFERPKRKGSQPQPERVKNAPPGIHRRQ